MFSLRKRRILFWIAVCATAIALLFGIGYLLVEARVKDRLTFTRIIGPPISAPPSIGISKMTKTVFEIEGGAYYLDENSDIVFLEPSKLRQEGESQLAWSGADVPLGELKIVGAGRDWIAVSEFPKHLTLTFVSLMESGVTESTKIDLGSGSSYMRMACAPYGDSVLIVWAEQTGTFARLVSRETLETRVEIEMPMTVGTQELLRIGDDMMLVSRNSYAGAVLKLTPQSIDVGAYTVSSKGQGIVTDDLFAVFSWSNSVHFYDRADGSFVQQLKIRDRYQDHVSCLQGDLLYVASGPMSHLVYRGWITCFSFDGKNATREFTIRLDKDAVYVDASSDGTVLIVQTYDWTVFRVVIDHKKRTYVMSRIDGLPGDLIVYSLVDNEVAQLFFRDSQVQVAFDE